MIDLTKHEWKSFLANQFPDPKESRNIIIVDTDGYVDLCEIFTFDLETQVVVYDQTINDFNVIKAKSDQLHSFRWDYIKVK